MAEAKRGGTERTGANAKTIRKRSQNHDTYKSIVFLPDAVGGGRWCVGSMTFRTGKTGRHPTPDIFPDFQFICRHKARTGPSSPPPEQWQTRARNANAIVVAIAGQRGRARAPSSAAGVLFQGNAEKYGFY